jgi:hypothetical protein
MKCVVPNYSIHMSRRLRFGFGGFGFFRNWIRCQRPIPVAVGELVGAQKTSSY